MNLARFGKQVGRGLILSVGFVLPARAEQFVGAASTNITPPLPVAVSGQFRLRLAKSIESPVTANVIALQSRDEEKVKDVAVLVSCDVVLIMEHVRI